jgi:hypothetical protein
LEEALDLSSDRLLMMMYVLVFVLGLFSCFVCFVFYFVCSVFLYCLCIVSPHVYSCFFSIPVQVYGPLLPGGNPIAVDKYHVAI